MRFAGFSLLKKDDVRLTELNLGNLREVIVFSVEGIRGLSIFLPLAQAGVVSAWRIWEIGDDGKKSVVINRQLIADEVSRYNDVYANCECHVYQKGEYVVRSPRNGKAIVIQAISVESETKSLIQKLP